MDNDLIKTLIDALEASSLTELEYSKGGETLRLVKRTGAPPMHPAAAVPAVERETEPVTPPRPSSTVNAPVFGVVHLQRSPGLPPLVTPGEAVSAGQVLCTIEAMKIFTELRAEGDGTVAAILVQSGQEVEAGQALFQMEGSR